MKSWKRAVTVALCAASLLAGCGGDCGLKDGEDYTVEDLRGINIPLALLERHEVVTVNVQYTDENGDVTYTARVQYTRNADGNVVSWGHYGYDPSENYPVSAKERWTQANGKVYLDRSSNEERTMMTCFTKIDYEMYVLADLPAIAEFEMGTEESEETIGLQNGVYLLSGSVTYPNLGGYHSKTLYEVEPGSGELHAMTVTDHAADDEAFDGKMRYTWSYDEPYKTEPYKSGRYLLNDVVYATDDTRPACLLTVCLPAEEGGEDWWVNEYHVARGTYVNICCRSGCTLYADAALTQPIDDTVSIDTNGEEMTVYVVPDVPLN